MLLALVKANLEPSPLGLAIGIAAIRQDALIVELKRIAEGHIPTTIELAALVDQKVIEKFDGFFDEKLLNISYENEHIDTIYLEQIARYII